MEKVLPLLEEDGGKARIIASYTNKCKQLIRQPIVYARKSITGGAKSTPFVHVCFIVCTQSDVSVMSMHKVYTAASFSAYNFPKIAPIDPLFASLILYLV
ncbi:hypothetical protein HOLleu_19527 [Holothuria leucospilota]|uniref:Uncharacterized protein n=1 Tax=Holothuria leucospilota TaxID=206669 RepID=A0A9Q1BZP7_HOLLE|nr:hypothetical protein HOLleu_19527 [Holothuria leucospilota]